MTEPGESRGGIPPCQIRVDRDGVWHFRGAEMFRKEIVDLFYEHLRFDESIGKYVIEMENDRCFIEVDDTPYVVRAVYRNGMPGGTGESIHVLLNSGKREPLDLSGLRIGEENVLYCNVREGRFPARFSRPAYYQLAQWIDYDEERDAYCIRLNNESFYLR